MKMPHAEKILNFIIMKTKIILLLAIFAMISCNDAKQKTEQTNADIKVKKGKSNDVKREGEVFFTTLDSVKIRYKVAGAGKPCLYIHGGPGQGFDSFELMKGNNLEKKLTMIYFDQRGSGNSEKAADYHMQAMLNDIEALRKHLGIQKFYVLAHSFGGTIATAYAKKYPEHVDGLILANCTLHFFNVENTKEQIKYADSLLHKKTENKTIDKESLLPIFLNLRQELSKKHLGYRFITDDVNSIIKMEEIDSLHPRINDFGVDVITKPEKYPEYYMDYAPTTQEIKLPTLVITGKDDHAVGTKHYKTFKFPNQKTVSIKGGHLLYYEHNDEFVNAVWNFVENQSKKQ